MSEKYERILYKKNNKTRVVNLYLPIALQEKKV